MSKKTSIFKIVFAIIFAIPMVIWGFQLKSFLINKDALVNGIETTAYVYDATNDETVNGSERYTLHFKFYDENGNSHEGKTSCIYSYIEAKEILDGSREIDIKYNPDNFNAVQSDFNGKPTAVLYFLPIFGIISLLVLLSAISDFIYYSKTRKILENGTKTVGYPISAKKGSIVNNVVFFSIQYRYKDNSGIEHIKKSKSEFHFGEKEEIMNKGTVDVFYLGNDSRISLQPNVTSNNTNTGYSNTSMAPSPMMAPTSQPNNIETNYSPKPYVAKKCEYCGAELPEGELVCPSCGAKNFAD